MEKAVKIQLEKYLEENSIIINQQSGFRTKYLCETAINLVLSDWKEAHKEKKTILSTFLDLKRAFETINRQLLLHKLQNIGIKGQLKWFTDYLADRKQQTVVGDAISKELETDIGLPQGSVFVSNFVSDIYK